MSLFLNIDEFKGHSLLQAAREADMAKVKKTLALEIIGFKHPQTNETALVSGSSFSLRFQHLFTIQFMPKKTLVFQKFHWRCSVRKDKIQFISIKVLVY